MVLFYNQWKRQSVVLKANSCLMAIHFLLIYKGG